ncbi:MAG: efflux RND transporter periplasmic adaptor subunit [Alphaproteobacteria bacterium]|nr:efflux RND transporter periplasmic adaptor subunit [Alphaproteobacteria bacterium]
MVRSLIKKLVICVLIILVIVGGYYSWKKMQSKPVAQTMQTVVDAIRVEAEAIIPKASFVAKIESKDTVGLRARVTGFLQERLFQEGDFVKKGQQLFVIERVNFEAAVREARANYDSAVATEKNALQSYERAQKLYKTKDISKAKLDDAEAASDSAKAHVAQAKARLDLAEQDLEYTIITAPMDGRIGEAAFSVGELIGPSSGVLAKIVTVNPMEAVFAVSENQLLLLRQQFKDAENTEVHFITADQKEYPEVGTLIFMDTTLDEAMNTLKMKASFPNPQYKLISGQYGRVVLQAKSPTDVLIIPQRAVQRTPGNEYVLVVNDEHKIEKRQIQTGAELDDFKVEVLSGLKVGETVVVDGFQKIAEGMPVEVRYLNMKQE